MRLTPRTSLLGGVALLAAAAVVLHIALVRLVAALFGHQYLPLALALPFVGAAVGGALLSLVPALARPPSLLARLAYLAGLGAAGAVGALLVVMHTDLPEALTVAVLQPVGLLYLACIAPFAVTGLAVSAVLQHAARHASRLYLAILAGGASGGVLAIAALRAGAPRAMLFVAIAFAVAGLVFYLGARPPREGNERAQAPRGSDPTGPASMSGEGEAVAGADRGPPALERPASGSVVAAFLLASVVLLAGDLGAPWLKLPHLRWAAIERVELEEWNELSLVTVDKPQAGSTTLRIDGSAATTLLDIKTTPPAVPDEMVYALQRGAGPVLVIGPGGLPELRAAVNDVPRDVYLAEVNPLVVNEVLRGRYRTFTGDLLSRPDVHVAIADGRGYARSLPVRFRSIILALSDAAAPIAAGATTLDGSDVYTVEAFRDYLEHLEPTGSMTVTRWDGEFERLLGLAVAGVASAGEVDAAPGARPRKGDAEAQKGPLDHLFACGHQGSTTLLIKRTRLAKAEIDALRRHCKKYHFAEVFAPDDPHEATRKQVAAQHHPGEDEALEGAGAALPTDDRPFFLYRLGTAELLAALRNPASLATGNQGLLVLLGLLGASLGLLLVAFLAGVARAASRVGPRVEGSRPVRSLLFFAGLGSGFVLAQMALVRGFVRLLGHPVYGLATAMLTLLLWAGAGSLFTSRTQARHAASTAGKRAQLLVAVLAVYAVALAPLVERGPESPFWARLALTLVVLAPVGLLMGSLLPLGVRMVSARAPGFVAACLGVHGGAALVALVGGTLLAVHFGYSTLLLGAGAGYLLAAATVPPPLSAWPGR